MGNLACRVIKDAAVDLGLEHSVDYDEGAEQMENVRAERRRRRRQMQMLRKEQREAARRLRHREAEFQANLVTVKAPLPTPPLHVAMQSVSSTTAEVVFSVDHGKRVTVETKLATTPAEVLALGALRTRIGHCHGVKVESAHPYPQMTTQHWLVQFPSSTSHVAVVFDPRSSTRASDAVRLLKSPRHLAMADRPRWGEFSRSTWPGVGSPAFVVPAESFVVELQASSHRSSSYGFRLLAYPVSDPFLAVQRAHKSVVVESLHPYREGKEDLWPVHIEGAHLIAVAFDLRTCTSPPAPGHFLQLCRDDSLATMWGADKYSGSCGDFPTLEDPLLIPADSFVVRFVSDDCVASPEPENWGFRLIAYAVDDPLASALAKPGAQLLESAHPYPSDTYCYTPVATPVGSTFDLVFDPRTVLLGALQDIGVYADESHTDYFGDEQIVAATLPTLQQPLTVPQTSADLYYRSQPTNEPQWGFRAAAVPDTTMEQLVAQRSSLVVESEHPYAKHAFTEWPVHLPDVRSMYCVFDTRSATDEHYHFVVLYQDATRSSFWGTGRYSGHGDRQYFPGVNGLAALYIPSNSCLVHFKSDGTDPHWGFRCVFVDADMWGTRGQGDSPSLRRLQPNTAYEVRVRAETGSGQAQFSDPVRFTTLPPTPAAPVLIRKGERYLDVAWEPCDVLRQRLLVQAHRVCPQCVAERRFNPSAKVCEHGNHVPDAELLLTADEPRHTITDLVPGTQYLVSVGFENETGWGVYSPRLVCATDVPPPPHPLHVTPFMASVKLAWHYPAVSKMLVDRYELQRRPEVDPALSRFVSDCAVITVESSHPYETEESRYWLVEMDDAEEIEVRFDPRSSTTRHNEFVCFYKDQSRTQVWGEPKYSGTHDNWPGVGSNPPLRIPAASFVVHFHSELFEPQWGFRLEAARAEPLPRTVFIESEHPYDNDTDQYWPVSLPGAQGLSLTFSPRSRTEDRYDYVRVYKDSDGDHTRGQWGQDYSGRNFPTDAAPLIVPADNCLVHFHSDYSRTAEGFWLTVTEYKDPLRVLVDCPDALVFESEHPYTQQPCEWQVDIPGARRLAVCFDPRTSTGLSTDVVHVDDSHTFSGRAGPAWPGVRSELLLIESSKCTLRFTPLVAPGLPQQSSWGVRVAVFAVESDWISLSDQLEAPEYRVGGLQPTTHHSFRVRTYCGASGWSSFTQSDVVSTTAGDIADTPANVVCTRQGGSFLVVGWDPIDESGLVLEEMELSYRQAGAAKQERWLSTPSNCIIGLSCDTEYEVRVRARNAKGWGEFSDLVSFRTAEPGPPALLEPPSLTLDAESYSSLVVSWNLPEANGAACGKVMLKVRHADAEVATKVHVGVDTSMVLTELPPTTLVSVSARAHNDFGWGEWTEFSGATATGPPPPAAPSAPQLQSATATSITFSWEPPADEVDEVQAYQIWKQRRQGRWTLVRDAVPGTIATIGELEYNSTAGRFKVRAGNRSGWGAFSEPSAAFKTYEIGTIARQPRFSSLTNTGGVLRWSKRGGVVDRYELQRLEPRPLPRRWPPDQHNAQVLEHWVTRLDEPHDLHWTVEVPHAVGVEVRFHHNSCTLPHGMSVTILPYGLDFRGGYAGAARNWPGCEGRPALVIPSAKFVVRFRSRVITESESATRRTDLGKRLGFRLCAYAIDDPLDALEQLPSCVVVESRHPYGPHIDQQWPISVPDTDIMAIQFSLRSSLEYDRDFVTVFKDASRADWWGLEHYTGGRDGTPKVFPGAGLQHRLLIPSSKAVVFFRSSKENPDWGFKLAAYKPTDARTGRSSRPVVRSEQWEVSIPGAAAVALWFTRDSKTEIDVDYVTVRGVNDRFGGGQDGSLWQFPSEAEPLVVAGDALTIELVSRGHGASSGVCWIAEATTALPSPLKLVTQASSTVVVDSTDLPERRPRRLKKKTTTKKKIAAGPEFPPEATHVEVRLHPQSDAADYRGALAMARCHTSGEPPPPGPFSNVPVVLTVADFVAHWFSGAAVRPRKGAFRLLASPVDLREAPPLVVAAGPGLRTLKKTAQALASGPKLQKAVEKFQLRMRGRSETMRNLVNLLAEESSNNHGGSSETDDDSAAPVAVAAAAAAAAAAAQPEVIWDGQVYSEHPYEHSAARERQTWHVSVPGAKALEICFDPRTATVNEYDYCRVYVDDSLTAFWGEERYSGGFRQHSRHWPGLDGTPSLVIPSNRFVLAFHTQPTGESEWGFRLRYRAYAGDMTRLAQATVIIESAHPYTADTEMTWHVALPRTPGLELRFDPRSATYLSDAVRLYDGDNELVAHGDPTGYAGGWDTQHRGEGERRFPGEHSRSWVLVPSGRVTIKFNSGPSNALRTVPARQTSSGVGAIVAAFRSTVQQESRAWGFRLFVSTVRCQWVTMDNSLRLPQAQLHDVHLSSVGAMRHVYRVRAQNQGGWGPYSPASSTVHFSGMAGDRPDTEFDSEESDNDSGSPAPPLLIHRSSSSRSLLSPSPSSSPSSRPPPLRRAASMLGQPRSPLVPTLRRSPSASGATSPRISLLKSAAASPKSLLSMGSMQSIQSIQSIQSVEEEEESSSSSSDSEAVVIA